MREQYIYNLFSSPGAKAIFKALNYVGKVKYKKGSKDCGSFICWGFRDAGYEIDEDIHTSQFQNNPHFVEVYNPQFGDVCVYGSWKPNPLFIGDIWNYKWEGHAAFYFAKNRILHLSDRRGVAITGDYVLRYYRSNGYINPHVRYFRYKK